jgi:Uma2 family endonuclease
MAAMTVVPRRSYDLTVDDLKSLRDDGLRYELLDGVLIPTPTPIPVHQPASGDLILLLTAACPAVPRGERASWGKARNQAPRSLRIAGAELRASGMSGQKSAGQIAGQRFAPPF